MNVAVQMLSSSGFLTSIGSLAVQGAQEVVHGVFMGGFEEARSGIKQGSRDASNFR